MAKRRKSRKLSGSPAEHRERAARSRGTAISRYKHAASLAKSGQCVLAFKEYSGATVSYGKSMENLEQSSARSWSSPSLSRAAVSADKAFFKHCDVVPKGRGKKLSRLGSAAVLDKPEQIAHYRNLVLLKSLETEVKFPGMKMTRGPTAYSRIKAEFGLKGTKAKVLEQFYRMVKG